MTYANGQFNLHPLANPFNTRLGPSNYSLNSFCPQNHRYFKYNIKASVPDPVEPSKKIDNLHTPYPDEKPMSLAELNNMMTSYSAMHTWNNSEIYANPLKPSYNEQCLNANSKNYWSHIADVEQHSTITPQQQKMLDDLDNGLIMPLSKLEIVEN